MPSTEDEETSPLVDVSPPGERAPNTALRKLLGFKVYKKRWLVLSLICLLNCSNAMLWLTFAPVADLSAQTMKVSLNAINWLSVVYVVVAIPLSFGATWMLDIVGLRATILLGSWLNMGGAVIRILWCVPAQNSFAGRISYPLVFFGQTLAAVAQPLIIFTPTKMAALWFPDHQRATANMMASMANPLGILIANIASPKLARTAKQLPILLLVYAIIACVSCFLVTVFMRRSAPPTPPSASAELSTSEPFRHGFKLLLRNRAYLLLLLCFGSGVAVFTCFSTLLDQILCVQGYTNDFAGLCGALFIAFGIVGAALLGLYVDKTKKFIEAIKVNMSLSAMVACAFTVVCLMQDQKVAVAIVCALFGFFGFSIYPAVMELTVECSYPVGEATSTGLVFISGQVQSLIYIILLQALTTPVAESPRSTCTLAPQSWKVPVMLLSTLCAVSSCIFLIFFHTPYRRLEAEKAAIYGTGQGNGTAASENK
ncbi:solute carrier family 49 member A3 [Entelurus aequoreus]|uniref:solute carrier family 49 member A3 n=1 Tax=Entelurus aequoreus TaxID=161455 RepID=UPI002B1D9CDA|nr:solute carrier family 49 member A3 [Entelurus aequoreus]XP_061895680.1 solute carrier family 49 member A3 [Entelurus aequoreus]